MTLKYCNISIICWLFIMISLQNQSKRIITFFLYQNFFYQGSERQFFHFWIHMKDTDIKLRSVFIAVISSTQTYAMNIIRFYTYIVNSSNSFDELDTIILSSCCLRPGFCDLNFLSIDSDFLSSYKMTQIWQNWAIRVSHWRRRATSEFAKLQF